MSELAIGNKNSMVAAVNEIAHRVFGIYDTMVDVPAGVDLLEYFKNMESNVLYRVNPGFGMINTCVPSTEYSWYIIEGSCVAGYDIWGNKYMSDFIGKTLTQWYKVATTQRTELVLLNGWQNHPNYRKVTAVRSGDIVTVTGMIYKEVPLTVGETVLILPYEYRPKVSVVQVPFYNGTADYPYADITPDGAVVMYRYQAGVLFFNFSYGI